MKIYEVRDILKADVLAGKGHLDQSVAAGGGADLMEDVLSAVAEGAVLLTGLTDESVLNTAQIAGVKAIVIVRGKKPNEKVLMRAAELNLPVLSTKFSLFVAAGRLYMNGLRGLDGSW